MNDWKNKPLGLICSESGGNIQTGPFGSQLHQSDYTLSGVPVIMPKDIVNDKINHTTVSRIPPFLAKKLRRHKLKLNNILFPRRGDIDKRVLIEQDDVDSLCGTGCLKIDVPETVLNPKFLYYYLTQPSIVEWIINQSIGATMENLNTSTLKKLDVFYPKLHTQQHITSILSTYDELIEVNNQRIKRLEETARELYKEWFVRMRFPGYKQTKFVKGVPMGWEIVPINSLYKTSSGGTPSREQKEYYNNGNHNWLKTGELLDTFVFETEERISDLGLKNSSAKLFPAYTVIFAMYGNTIGQLGIITQPSATNQACCALMPQTDGFHFEFIFLTLLQHRETIISFGMGAAQQNINQEEIKKFKILKPTYDLAVNFKNVVNPFFKQIEIFQKQNTQLRQIRDRLLPRLISGKLEPKNINQITTTIPLQAVD